MNFCSSGANGEKSPYRSSTCKKANKQRKVVKSPDNANSRHNLFAIKACGAASLSLLRRFDCASETYSAARG
jgi:hypothetical protein